MAVANSTLDIERLKTAAKYSPGLVSHVRRLEGMRDMVREQGEDFVLWAVAHGSFVELIGTGKARSTAREKYLFVTNLDSVYASYEALADYVLGPLMDKTGRFIEYEAWTVEEFRRIAKRGTNELLQSALTKGVTLFGLPPLSDAD